jgi:hypothetical protein
MSFGTEYVGDMGLRRVSAHVGWHFAASESVDVLFRMGAGDLNVETDNSLRIRATMTLAWACVPSSGSDGRSRLMSAVTA